MDFVARVFDNFEDADRADADYYAGLSPKERVDTLLDLIENYRRSLGSADRFERVCRVIDSQES
jgi:hypothetical protein